MLKLPLLTYAGYYIFVSSSRTANHKTSQDYVLLGQEKETLGQRHAEALDGGLAFCQLVESPQISDLCLTERYEHAIFKHCRSTSISNISK